MIRFPMWRRIALFLLALAGAPAHAAIDCNLISSGFTTGYEAASAGNDVNAGSVTITCTRSDLNNDPTVLNYSLRADDGGQLNNGSNRARLNNSTGNNPARFIRYDLFRDPACATAWTGGLFNAASDFEGTINFGSTATAVASTTLTFYACVPPGQNSNAGTFTDTVNIYLCTGAGVLACFAQGSDTTTFTATIINPAACSLTTPPGNVVFNYTSFQAAPAAANTSYSVRCTSGVPYTASLDAAPGPLQGLAYTLTLGTPGQVIANGQPQAHAINGSIPAGQPGICANATCPQATQGRTLTITY